VSEVCREHHISLSLFYHWKDKFMEGALKALSPQSHGLGDRKGGEVRQFKAADRGIDDREPDFKKTQELMSPRSK